MKNTFIKNTLTLSITGLLVKGLGLVNRIVITRLLGTDGIGIYMMSFPTIILFISLAQLGLPIAISKLISENRIKKTTKNSTIIYNSLSISLIMSCVLMLLLLLVIKPLANTWLNNSETFYPILTTVILIPLVSFSGILKGYLHGLKMMKITGIAHVAEQVVRIVASIILVYVLLPYGLIVAVTASLLSISLGEIVSIIILFFKINKISHNAKIHENITQEIKEIIEQIEIDEDLVDDFISRETDLRSMLIEFDNEVIRKRQPNKPENQPLLRPEMLETLLEYMPTSKWDFLEDIPSYLRQAKPSNKGKYLDQVFEIINSKLENQETDLPKIAEGKYN